MQEKGETITHAVLIISAIFLLVAIFVVAYFLYFKKRKTILIEENNSIRREFQQQLLQSRVEVQEHTFQHIGKDLHDNVGQLLSSSRMLLGLTERELVNPPDTLLTANATLAQAIAELRTLSKSLDTDWLSQFNFVENLQAEIGRINAGGTVAATLEFEDIDFLNPDEQIILFRIVQEAMQNAIKHADPHFISISIQRTIGSYIIIIEDDGKGFNLTDHASGLGITNMKYRTALLGGTIKWEKLSSKGTVITIELPDKAQV